MPQAVSVSVDGRTVTAKGPKGEMTQSFHRDMAITAENGSVVVNRPSDQREHRALHGLTRSLISNMIEGVSQGFAKTLEFVGVGYRVQQNGKGVTLSVMLSHTVDVDPPDGVTLEVEGNNIVKVSGIDKQAVGQVAAEIRSKRPPMHTRGTGSATGASSSGSSPARVPRRPWYKQCRRKEQAGFEGTLATRACDARSEVRPAGRVWSFSVACATCTPRS